MAFFCLAFLFCLFGLHIFQDRSSLVPTEACLGTSPLALPIAQMNLQAPCAHSPSLPPSPWLLWLPRAETARVGLAAPAPSLPKYSFSLAPPEKRQQAGWKRPSGGIQDQGLPIRCCCSKKTSTFLLKTSASPSSPTLC